MALKRNYFSWQFLQYLEHPVNSSSPRARHLQVPSAVTPVSVFPDPSFLLFTEPPRVLSWKYVPQKWAWRESQYDALWGEAASPLLPSHQLTLFRGQWPPVVPQTHWWAPPDLWTSAPPLPEHSSLDTCPPLPHPGRPSVHWRLPRWALWPRWRFPPSPVSAHGRPEVPCAQARCLPRSLLTPAAWDAWRGVGGGWVFAAWQHYVSEDWLTSPWKLDHILLGRVLGRRGSLMAHLLFVCFFFFWKKKIGKRFKCPWSRKN